MSLQDQQKRLLLCCIASAIITGGVMYLLLAPSKAELSPSAQSGPHSPWGTDTTEKDAIKTPGETVQSNELWMQKMSHDSALQGKKLEIIEKALHKQLTQDNTTLAGTDQLTPLKQELGDLKKQLQDLIDNGLKSSDPNTADRGLPTYSPLIKHELVLQGGLYTVKTRIPPGAYVKAVLLSAVDVGVGVNVSADPQPALLRLLGEGHLPNNACSHLKRCHIVGATVGDLSSERAFIRLEKMSCVHTKTGQIVETDVSGYVTGEDGKNGLAGVVVDRSGRMISSAVLVGLISGVSSVAQSLATAKLGSPSPLGDPNTLRGVQNNVLSSEFMKGSTQGTTGAFDKLADYYVKRAEQLQPVIQINAGRVVHIVFTKGSNLGTEKLLSQVPLTSTPKM